MQPVAGLAGPGKVDVTSKLFRPDRAMHEPLLVPDSLECSRGYFRKQSRDVRLPKVPNPTWVRDLLVRNVEPYGFPGFKGAPLPINHKAATK